LNSFYAEYARDEKYTKIFSSAPAIDFMELINNPREDTLSPHSLAACHSLLVPGESDPDRCHSEQSRLPFD
jgi:hypothetical protein